MNTLSGKQSTALVTGASSGIGLELARTLAADGHSLVLVARERSRLEIAAAQLQKQFGVDVRLFPADLSESGAAEKLWSKVSEANLAIDILVNNAGGGLYGRFQDQSPDALDRMQMVNVVALTALTRLALPQMIARRRGRILNVASVVGYQPGGPGMSVYYATKAYVLSFTKGLALELAETGVSATALCPGLTMSAFERRSGGSDSRLYRLVPQLSPTTVAQAGYRGMMRGRVTVIPGFVAKFFAFTGELPPRGVALFVNRWLLGRASA